MRTTGGPRPLGQGNAGRPGLPEHVWQTVNDQHRLARLHALETIGTESDADFNRIAQLAGNVMGTPVALVSLLEAKRQWFKARTGFERGETPIEQSFCAHAIAAGNDVMVVEDALHDPRFAENPLVTGEDHVRFYVGAPIVVGGATLGTLCVLDREPRPRPSPEVLAQLEALAALASSLFALKEGTRSGALARAALLREEARKSVALDAAGIASWVWDARSDLVECDPLMQVLLGMPQSTRLTARRIFSAIDRRDVGQIERWFRTDLSEGDEFAGEYRIRHTDPVRWLAARGRVIERDPEGRPALIFGVNYDISEAKSGEIRQRILLRELNHRVKNTLATVQALASQTVRHARDPREFLEAFSSRLQALGLAHGLLSDHEWRGIRIGDLVRREVKPFDDPQRQRIAMSGADILLSPDQAVGLGLILHELASNAMKYGSLSVPDGTVELGWHVDGRDADRQISVDWKESGGPAVVPPERTGFGSILIRRSLAKVLSSQVEHVFAPEGVTARITMPLDQQQD
ncbi:MAG: GAF domain-containing protein [Alphaproteobacteria bacterium]|nr:GAF domain-containing protein [Alphaproteobacteria bacterium]MBU0870588.1 GAF domain-containing protein [Alphaproteobacteria bacterium]MBU1401737.1 GAF domain-containing protein [Alphaproteobacteria bacterium]MBU1591846.1 GAF domain-containing protein [Alphaproteobacteria bacterium]MBU1790589.1 GAF domain-containing protein [Alphaproteobacteria bacterium]